MCLVCQVSTTDTPTVAPMVPTPIVEKPFKQITMDIVGPFLKSSMVYQYVLVIMD